ncbi:MAG: hypothetical protein NZM44_06980, partial [Candidatus Calescibacterium sp.]|nr:hypothetical protein [Candidatus Calescibacterium sp.]
FEFIYEPKDYWHIIENANNDVFVNSDFYFRFGNQDYYDIDTDTVRSAPIVEKPTYRLSAIDGLCFTRLFLKCQDKNYNSLKTELNALFDKFESFQFIFFDDFYFTDDDKIKAFDVDTYWIPIFYNNRKTQNFEIRFLYGSYYGMLPPISTVPQFHYGTESLDDEFVWLYTPHKRFLWNYKNTLRLYKVFYDNNNNETNRLTYSLPATEYAIGNVKIEKYNIVGGYQNNEFIKDFTGSIVNSPRYIVGDESKNLSRITPYHGHTYNYSKDEEQQPQIDLFVYRAWQDIEYIGKIYLIGYNKNTQQYLYGHYNIKTGETILLPQQERSIDFTLINNEAYLEYIDEIGTEQTQSRYEYKIFHGNEELRRIRIKGRRPCVVFDNDIVIIASREDRYGGHFVQYFDFSLNRFVGDAKLLFANLSDIDNLQLPFAEYISVLDKENKIFIHAYHWNNTQTNKKDVGIRFFDTKDGLNLDEFSPVNALYFSDVFQTNQINFAYSTISELSDGVIVWACGDNKKVYGIKLRNNYRAGRNYEKIVLDFSGEQYNLVQYHTPCVFTSNCGIMFVNTNQGVKQIFIDEYGRKLL